MMKPFRVRNFRFVNIDGIVCIDSVSSHRMVFLTRRMAGGGWQWTGRRVGYSFRNYIEMLVKCQKYISFFFSFICQVFLLLRFD